MEDTSQPKNYLINKSNTLNIEGMIDLSEFKNEDHNKNTDIDMDDVGSNFSFNADHTDKNKVEVNVDYDYEKYLKP